MKVPSPFLSREIGAGDVVKSVTSALGIPQCAPCKKRQEKMNRALTLTPRTAASAVTRPNVWTKPPETPEGWTLEQSCDSAALFRNGDKRIVWSIVNGEYRNSHTFCCGSPEQAIREFETRCRS